MMEEVVELVGLMLEVLAGLRTSLAVNEGGVSLEGLVVQLVRDS
jgi:hypothetical protein